MNTDFSFLPRRSRTKAGLPSNFCFPSFNPPQPSTFARLRALSGQKPSREDLKKLLDLIGRAK
jgi:hypothetical protein